MESERQQAISLVNDAINLLKQQRKMYPTFRDYIDTVIEQLDTERKKEQPWETMLDNCTIIQNRVVLKLSTMIHGVQVAFTGDNLT